jgi:hypothetical protein
MVGTLLPIIGLSYSNGGTPMKRREFVQMTALAAGGMLSGQVVSAPANAASNLEGSPTEAAGHREEAFRDGKRQIIGPRKTLKELRASVEQSQPELGQPQQTADNPFKYAYHLEGTWANAEWAQNQDPSDPNSPVYGNPYFDRDGKRQNDELRKAINEVFIKHKKIDLTDPDGPQWVLAWRMYPNKDHRRWQTEDCCGCCCGCAAPGSWPAE